MPDVVRSSPINMRIPALISLIRNEWFLAASAGSALCFAFFGHQLLGAISNPLWLGAIFLWLFAAVLGSALAVVRHAEHLAVRLGEPYGTLILTLSVTAIENCGNEALRVPSLTLRMIFEKVPTSAAVGVPDNSPVPLLKAAQLGAF